MMRRLTQPLRIMRYLLVFLRELVIANARVAWEVVTPGLTLKPAIVRVPTRTRTSWERTVLANTITMTPGTLTLEVDEVSGDLYVHSLYVDDRESFRASIKVLEDVILGAMR
jgi:multicomponent Na+:H+ antiporter subunit E